MNTKMATYNGGPPTHIPPGICATVKPTIKETIRTGMTNKGVPCKRCGQLGWNGCTIKHKTYSNTVLKTITATIVNGCTIQTLVTLECQPGDDGSSPLNHGWNSMRNSLPSVGPPRSAPPSWQPQPQPDTPFSSFQTL